MNMEPINIHYFLLEKDIKFKGKILQINMNYLILINLLLIQDNLKYKKTIVQLYITKSLIILSKLRELFR